MKSRISCSPQRDTCRIRFKARGKIKADRRRILAIPRLATAIPPFPRSAYWAPPVAASSLPPCGKGLRAKAKTIPPRRRALAPELSKGKSRKRLPPAKSEGRRSADRRTWHEPHQRAWLGLLSGAVRLSALHRGSYQGFDPLAQLRAALRGIAWCKREDPPRRQCSKHLALRS
jgi:hypothetical protein